MSAVAAEWADVASTSKGIEPGHPLRGEEWLGGPYATLVALDAYRDSLRKLAKGVSPLDGVKTDASHNRVRAHVFPLSPVDSLLLSGYTGEVWFEPGVTEREARRAAGPGPAHADPSRVVSGSCSERATSPRSRSSTCCTSCSRPTAR